MKPKHRSRNDRQAQELLKLLAVFPHTISDYLWAAITLGNSFPALADQFEAMAQQEIKQFRLLGELMLRRGFDPTLQTLLRNGAILPLQGSLRGDTSVESLLMAMKNRAEQTLALARRILTVPCLEEEDIPAELLTLQEESLRRLVRMLS
ncbi:MAG: hypothetical protein E7668_03350 [Ruminococcaceae bacterium]|nr:hypothetical protein [Oscillospiraceae bacterium]